MTEKNQSQSCSKEEKKKFRFSINLIKAQKELLVDTSTTICIIVYSFFMILFNIKVTRIYTKNPFIFNIILVFFTIIVVRNKRLNEWFDELYSPSSRHMKIKILILIIPLLSSLIKESIYSIYLVLGFLLVILSSFVIIQMM